MILIYINLSCLIEITHERPPHGTLLLHKKGILAFICADEIFYKNDVKIRQKNP